MRYDYIKDGQRVEIVEAAIIDDVMHPLSSIQLMTDAERQAIGVLPHQVQLVEAKAVKKGAITAYRDAIFNKGYTVKTGVMAGHILQTRTTGEDRTNWLTSQASYKAAIDAGQGAVEGANFRTKDNVNFTVSFNEGHAVILAMAAWGAEIVDRAWALSDLATAATTQAELDAIDITTGWPA